ncbi:MAG: [FeFe] hydrogenase H-cluster radical SAM maturase HydE [Deltaproteobacteria bacterium]|nr:[FeFe] hydrogenase H-cluster radical SAM maturase HydE [Deltaproteobacteria bacterium]
MEEKNRSEKWRGEEANKFTRDELVNFLCERDPDENSLLYMEADRIRKMYMGDEVHIRGVIEFSNYCKRDCLYCGLRKSNDQIVRYRMGLEGIYRAAEEAKKLNFKTVVLQSGEDPHYSVEDLSPLIRIIRMNLNLAVTLSILERSFEEYRRFREAGADRYLLKFETCSPSLFKRLKPDSTYTERFRCLEWVQELGYQVGSGNIIGLPEQSLESLAEDILFFQKLNLDMVGIGSFIPHPNTPLKGTPSRGFGGHVQGHRFGQTCNAQCPYPCHHGRGHPSPPWGGRKPLLAGPM